MRRAVCEPTNGGKECSGAAEQRLPRVTGHARGHGRHPEKRESVANREPRSSEVVKDGDKNDGDDAGDGGDDGELDQPARVVG